ncbi:penicillin-binding protein 2 [Zymobacter sp. IVIA_5232.4 C2]|uniref:penicillin-binding protein 2 n=1 Tax=Zymobacter sp. IVIA_5232.4 C2 TaxID=3394855 RepID=UPI0039C217FA
MLRTLITRLRDKDNKPTRIKDTAEEVALFRGRCLAAAAMVVLMTCGIMARMVYLQVFQHEEFLVRSDNNRIRIEPLPPTRGLIYDREGRLLAENRPTYNLIMVRERSGDVTQTLETLMSVLELPQDMLDELKDRSLQRQRPFQPAVLLSDLSEGQIARLALNRYRLPGLDVEAQLLRYYPDSDVMAHVLGYVGRISQDDLTRLDPDSYAGTHFVGKIGIERFYEKELHGQAGMRQLEANARGRLLGELSRTPPVRGKDVVLTIDSALQHKAYEELSGRRGAIVAIDPKTGGILAMASSPGFDANMFVTGISRKDYQSLQDDKDLPLYARAVQGRYPPASTIKPYMALAGLDSGVVTPGDAVNDPGFYELPNDPSHHKYRNWFRWGHGRVDMPRAILLSNDTYFFNLAHNLGIERMSAFMHRFGFGEEHSLDVWGAGSGTMPDPEWKRRRYNRERDKVWFPGETLSAGIGQGYVSATPLQIATAAAVLANRGKWVRPHLAARIGTHDVLPPFPDTPPDIDINYPNAWNIVINAMKGVADNSDVLRDGRHYTLAAKTGTAQVFTVAQDKRYNASEIDERKRDHALFIGFAPVENPQIAVAVIVENAGWGGKIAGPIGRHIIDEWMKPGAEHEVKILSGHHDETLSVPGEIE